MKAKNFALATTLAFSMFFSFTASATSYNKITCKGETSAGYRVDVVVNLEKDRSTGSVKVEYVLGQKLYQTNTYLASYEELQIGAYAHYVIKVIGSDGALEGLLTASMSFGQDNGELALRTNTPYPTKLRCGLSNVR